MYKRQIMRSMDLSNVPLIASIFAFGVNVGANYVFIFGKLGFPKMGVAGAALGTVIARAIETVSYTHLDVYKRQP